MDSPFAINHLLRSKGLATLSQAGALVSQIAFLIRDEVHFRILIMACEESERGNMYNTLKPNLRFKVRPLHEYIIEQQRDAEARQLPTVGPGGTLIPFKVPEVKTEPDVAAVEELVSQAVAKEHLRVVCGKCTKIQQFDGITKQDCVEAARAAGWKRQRKFVRDEPNDKIKAQYREVCHECP